MGALNLRLPESLHERARRLAEKEGISLNQFILLALAEKSALLEVGVTSLPSADLVYLGARAKRGREQANAEEKSPQEVLGALLDQVLDVAIPEDESSEDASS